MTGPLVYLWLLCLVPAILWSINMVYDTRGVRNSFQITYGLSVGLSIVWSLLTPWIMGAAFWGNYCTEIYIDGKTGKSKEIDRCTQWHVAIMLAAFIRLPFQLAIYKTLGAYTEELKVRRLGAGGAEYEEV